MNSGPANIWLCLTVLCHVGILSTQLSSSLLSNPESQVDYGSSASSDSASTEHHSTHPSNNRKVVIDGPGFSFHIFYALLKLKGDRNLPLAHPRSPSEWPLLQRSEPAE